MTGQIGGGYGPYAYNGPGGHPQQQQQPTMSPSLQSLQNRYSSRNSSLPSPFATLNQPPSSSGHSAGSNPRLSSRNMAASTGSAAPLIAGPTRHAPVFTARDAELDDKLHNPSPSDKYDDHVSCTAFSLRGWLNVAGILILVSGLIVLFAGYPIIQWAQSKSAATYGAYNIGGINASGQVPNIPGLPSLIDKDTPPERLTRTGFDGQKYVLVFSDEVSLQGFIPPFEERVRAEHAFFFGCVKFNTDGRTFWPGDDPFWEAVDVSFRVEFSGLVPNPSSIENLSLVLRLSFAVALLGYWRLRMYVSLLVAFSLLTRADPCPFLSPSHSPPFHNIRLPSPYVHRVRS